MTFLEKVDSGLLNLFATCSEQSYTYLCDLDQDITRWSAATVEFFGFPSEYMENTAAEMRARMHPDDVKLFQKEMDKLRSGESDRFYCESRIKNAAGVYTWVRSRGEVSVCKKDGTRIFVGSLLNVGAASNIGNITGLVGGHDTCVQVEDAIRAGRHGAMMLFGLDNFKWVNDMYGYPGGDQVLRFIGQEMRKIPYGSFHRMDGDKFLCLISEFESDAVERTFAAVQKILDNLPKLNGEAIRLTTTCGVARFPEDAERGGELRTRAEYALEYAKHNRRGSIAYYSSSLHEHAVTIYQLRDTLRYAVEHDFEGFWLTYQPLVRAEDSGIFGAEALLRFTTPDGRFVSPAEFIPVLEHDGMIRDVGAWVLRTALKQVREWRQFIPDFCVSINVSYIQMEDPNFRKNVMDALEENGVTTDGLILELTESCRHSAPEHLQEDFKFFAEKNIRMALDDFGTGYSSIDVLRRLMPPWIKLDHTFVSAITESRMDEAILEYILQLCHHAKIKVCVEGIENQDVLHIVQRYNPQLLQGYYFSKPLPAYDFEKNYIEKRGA